MPLEQAFTLMSFMSLNSLNSIPQSLTWQDFAADRFQSLAL